MARRLWLHSVVLVVSCSLGSPARAQSATSSAAEAHLQETPRPAPPAAAEPLLSVPAGKGQARLSVERRGEALLAAVCRASCDWAQAAQVTLEPSRDATRLRAQVLELGAGRRAAHVTLADSDRAWHWVVAAPLSGSQPVVAFAGDAGLTRGEAPDRTGTMVELLRRAGGEVDVVVGELREDVDLCGRRALLAPRVLYAKDLTLRRVKLQRLAEAEREAAPRLTAHSERVSTLPLLQARVASSATGDPRALTDGNPGTYWAENRSGAGGGEFVVMRSPPEIPLRGFSFSLVPVPANPDGVAPRHVFLATDSALFGVEFPEDARAGDGGEYTVVLPEPLSTSCVALVLDEAYGDEPEAQLTIADLAAVPAEGAVDVEQALLDLDRGGEAAQRAEAVLGVLGAPAFELLSRRYLSLSEGGRVRALRVMGQAPCEHAAIVYVAALTESSDAERRSAEASLRRCREQGVEAMARLLPKVDAARTRALAPVLTELDPARAVLILGPLLEQVSSNKRAILRQSLARAAATNAGRDQVRGLLNAEVDRRQAIEVMRALGPELETHRARAVELIATWLRQQLTYEERYLLVAPMAQLAGSDRRFSQQLARWIEADPVLPVRAHAARLTPPDESALPTLLRALRDSEVRVREAAVENLGSHRVAAAEELLLGLLNEDPWPLVRSATVRAVSRLPVTQRGVQALARAAADDESPEVRRPAVLALGRLRATGQRAMIRQRFDADDDPHVRAAAAAVLGQLCDTEMTARLLETALKLASLQASENDVIVGRAALQALGRIAPSDLKQRLAPLLAPEAPPPTRRAAGAALKQSNVCTQVK